MCRALCQLPRPFQVQLLSHLVFICDGQVMQIHDLDHLLQQDPNFTPVPFRHWSWSTPHFLECGATTVYLAGGLLVTCPTQFPTTNDIPALVFLNRPLLQFNLEILLPYDKIMQVALVCVACLGWYALDKTKTTRCLGGSSLSSSYLSGVFYLLIWV